VRRGKRRPNAVEFRQIAPGRPDVDKLPSMSSLNDLIKLSRASQQSREANRASDNVANNSSFDIRAEHPKRYMFDRKKKIRMKKAAGQCQNLNPTGRSNCATIKCPTGQSAKFANNVRRILLQVETATFIE